MWDALDRLILRGMHGLMALDRRAIDGIVEFVDERLSPAMERAIQRRARVRRGRRGARSGGR